MTAQVDKPMLALVSDEIYRLDRKPETTPQRVRRLQAEAKILAREQIESFERAMRDVVVLAAEIATGGDAYPVGVREMSARLAEDLEAKAQTVRALLDRTPEPQI